jgi:hypothetical protein
MEEGEAGKQANGETSGNETRDGGGKGAEGPRKERQGDQAGKREQEGKQARTEGTPRRCQQNATDGTERLKTG